jgi:hypothetical protein
MTLLRSVQAARVARERAKVERLFPQALRRWRKLFPALELRKLAALERLLSGEIQRGRREP